MVQLGSMAGLSGPALALAAVCLPSLAMAATSSTTVTSLDLITLYPTTTRVTIVTVAGGASSSLDSGTSTSTVWVSSSAGPSAFLNAKVGLFDLPSTLVTQTAKSKAAALPAKNVAASAQLPTNTVVEVIVVTGAPPSAKAGSSAGTAAAGEATAAAKEAAAAEEASSAEEASTEEASYVEASSGAEEASAVEPAPAQEVQNEEDAGSFM